MTCRAYSCILEALSAFDLLVWFVFYDGPKYRVLSREETIETVRHGID